MNIKASALKTPHVCQQEALSHIPLVSLHLDHATGLPGNEQSFHYDIRKKNKKQVGRTAAEEMPNREARSASSDGVLRGDHPRYGLNIQAEASASKHFWKSRQVDHLRPGVRDQPGQYGETLSLLKIQKLAGNSTLGPIHLLSRTRHSLSFTPIRPYSGISSTQYNSPMVQLCYY
ncbi:hypothetical protein AAY473_035739 [Plecturocebus cupreus]